MAPQGRVYLQKSQLFYPLIFQGQLPHVNCHHSQKDLFRLVLGNV